MKRIVENVPVEELRSGDVVQSGTSLAGTVNVEREDGDPHPPGTMLEFTDGRKAFKVMNGYQRSERPQDAWLILFADGSKGYYTYGYIRENMDVKEPEQVKPTQPNISWQSFVDMVIKVDDDNLLQIDGDSLRRLAVFTADRLGLR